MHRIAATPGGWNPDSEGVIFVEQTPAPIVFLTAADTDIQTLAASVSHLPAQFPALRVVNFLQLQQQLSIDTYAETVLSQAKVIILRLLGGRAYWTYGLEVVKETVEATGASLFILPGDDSPDPDLVSHSTVSLVAVNQLWRYFTEGGIENCVRALQFAADVCLGCNYNPPKPQPVPRVGVYSWWHGEAGEAGGQGSRGAEERLTHSETISPPHLGTWAPPHSPTPKVGILFYRAHYQAGNTAPIDALCEALAQRQLETVPIFVSSLSNSEVQAELLPYFQPEEGAAIQVLLNTTSFSLAKIGSEEQPDFWRQLDVPVLQVILSGSTVEQWESGWQGLTPRDVAMNVALPEVDGRIITRAISFKSAQTWNSQLEADVVAYQPVPDRVNFVAELAANWVSLRQTPAAERKIALILANYPNRDGRLANGVGLDTPASCIEILKALQQAGYQVGEIPETGEELIASLTAGVTNDPEGQHLRYPQQQLSVEEYRQYFATLPEDVQKAIGERWGEASLAQERRCPGVEEKFSSTPLHSFSIPGVQFGNVFVGIQPSRGYDSDPSLSYHSPDLEPTHTYLAFYYWLRQHLGASAVVHVGKHGNLEWLPGKGVALSDNCYPEVSLGAMPHFYPFIVNDPGEGSQAKRRSQAVIVDHLTPPMTRAELYGSLQQLEGLIDEYYEAQSLDPSRLKLISDRITQLVTQENLHQDLGIEHFDTINMAEFLTRADGYLCELKEAQIRDGLHIFGQCPPQSQLRDLMVAIARIPDQNRLGLTRAIAQDLGLDFDPLTADLSKPFSFPPNANFAPSHLCGCRTIGDAVEVLEEQAAELVESLISYSQEEVGEATQKELQWMRDHLLPSLQQTPQEITHLLRGLEGKYIPSGSAGAPTRGRADVLPTGRNFYSVDIRGIPTETAWNVGRKAAEAVIERYTQENGEYPRTLAISVWGTSTMRTGGDDVAEALALLGVQPVWEGVSRRVVDFEILPLSVLERPRVDVTLRISGFFRDGFPNLTDLFNQIVKAVASLDEPPEQNPLAAQVKQETELWQQQGLNPEQAEERSRYRVFGSKPGAYGAGLQGLIEAQNWTSEEDLARAYINWSSYAYTGKGEVSGVAAPEAFEQRLQQMQVVLHNQDNREHDIVDSDDYYQFQGGLTAAVRSVKGENPQTYLGDNSITANPRVRQLREEMARVYRSRVVNPKWIEGAMRHGYKGAFEMSATVDYLFAYDATTQCVEDHMYQGVAQAYLFDSHVQEFVQQKNPWALRDMAERLLEAHQRGLWQSAKQETLEGLRGIVNQAEGAIEERG